MKIPTTTAALTAIGFSRGAIQRARNYARAAHLSVPALVRECVEDGAWEIALHARPLPSKDREAKGGR